MAGPFTKANLLGVRACIDEGPRARAAYSPTHPLNRTKKGRPPRWEAGPSETERTFFEAARSPSRLMLSVGQAFQPDELSTVSRIMSGSESLTYD